VVTNGTVIPQRASVVECESKYVIEHLRGRVETGGGYGLAGLGAIRLSDSVRAGYKPPYDGVSGSDVGDRRIKGLTTVADCDNEGVGGLGRNDKESQDEEKACGKSRHCQGLFTLCAMGVVE